MLTLTAPDRHKTAQVTITRDTLTQVGRLWALIGVADIDGGWSGVGPSIVGAVTAGQYRAAELADGYVDDVAAEQGINAPAEGQVVAGRFAGVAADGRALDTLLREPTITAKTLIGQGMAPRQAWTSATTQLRMLATTTLQDTGRAAVGAATTARPRLGGYARMLTPPSCARCVILAGRFYRWSSGFRRHPRCDCRHIPSTEARAGDLTTDPAAYVASLGSEGRDRLLGKAHAQALADGADLNALVNARRAGLADLSRTGRATPEAIYRAADGDRALAVRLLTANGYIR